MKSRTTRHCCPACLEFGTLYGVGKLWNSYVGMGLVHYRKESGANSEGVRHVFILKTSVEIPIAEAIKA